MLLLKLPFLAGPPLLEACWESPAEVASTFFALAAVGFIKLDPPPPFLWTLVALGFAAPPLAFLGSVVLRTLVLEATVEAALLDPARLMELATELRDAPELDLLRFSFELVGRLVAPCRWLTALLAGLRRLEIDSEDLTEFGRPPLLPSSAATPDLLVELPPPVVAPRFKDLVDELMLGWLPPLRLLIGFRSPNRLLLFRGLTMVLDDAERSFRRPFVRSFDRSRILVNAPRGFSGGKLVALEEVTEALASEVFDARVESVARFVRDVDRPLESLSNTLEPEDLRGGSVTSLADPVRESLSINEFFRVTGFFRSFRL